MTRVGIIALAAMSFLTLGTFWGSYRGWGIPKPTKRPPSLREGSVKGKPGVAGYRRGHYFFVGGGPRYGK